MLKTIVTIAVFLAPAPALAEPGKPVTVSGERIPEDVRTAFADYADLDLTSERDRQRLQARIRGAVRQVCPDSGMLFLSERIVVPKCRSDAFAQAEAQMDQAIADASAGEQFASGSAIAISAR